MCMACLRKYDLPYKYKDWPAWVKALVRTENRLTRIERREEAHVSYEETQDIINESIV